MNDENIKSPFNYKEHTIYIINGRVTHIFPELFDIHGKIVYTNKYKEYTTRIVNIWDNITVRFTEDKGQCGDFKNSELHYIDLYFYILLDNKLQKVNPPKDCFMWDTYPDIMVDEKRCEEEQ